MSEDNLPNFGPAFPVKPFCAIMAPSTALLNHASRLLENEWGPQDFSTPIYRVDDFTTYYQEEMGAGLLKQMLSFKHPQSVAEMNQSKFITAALEDEYRQRDRRTINLDPGYLTLDKLVLYTTKNFTHRLFLERGLFAEITLTYTRQGWRTHSWTYPDYQTEAALAFFTSARQNLYDQLQSTGDLPKFNHQTGNSL